MSAGRLKAGSYNYARLAQNDTITPLFKSTVLSGAGGTANPIFSDNLGLDHGGLTHKIFHTGLTIDYELPHNILFSSLTSYTDDRYSLIHDYDNQNSDSDPNPYYGVLPNAPPTYNWLFNTQSKNYDYSQEFRLRGDFGPLKAMVGASYTYNYVQYDNAALSPYGPGDFVNGDPQKTETYGLFFSGAYTFLRQWTINFEGRYQDDKVIQDKRAAHNGPVSFVSSGTFDNFVPRVTLQYKPTPLTQVYATYSEGVNPGTFNGSFISSYTSAQLAYINAHYPGVGYQVQPEKLTNYELGAKGEFLERTLQLNGSVYYNEWTNQIVYQNLIIPLNCGAAVCSTTSAGFYTNIGKTTLYGVEFEGSYKVNQHLTLDASASYNESNIDSFQSATAQSLTGNPTVKNKRLPQYSPYSANIGGEYRAPFLADLEYYARVDYVYKSGQYDSVVNLTKTEASNVVNVRLGLSRPDPEPGVLRDQPVQRQDLPGHRVELRPFGPRIWRGGQRAAARPSRGRRALPPVVLRKGLAPGGPGRGLSARRETQIATIEAQPDDNLIKNSWIARPRLSLNTGVASVIIGLGSRSTSALAFVMTVGVGFGA